MRSWNCWLLVATTLQFTLLLSGCDQFANLRKPEKTHTLLVAGSSSLKPVTDKLMHTFRAKRPEVIVVTEGGGSTAGLIALRQKAIDVAGLSRDVHHGEDAPNIICVPLARDAIGFVVHPSNALNSLAPAQLHAMLIGTKNNWTAVGGREQIITIHAREKNSTTHQGVDDLLLHGHDLTFGAIYHESAQAMVDAIAAEPTALGFVSLADMNNLPPQMLTRIKLLKVNGVPMNQHTILSGRYPLTRAFYYAFRSDMTPVAREFMDFTMSAEGQQLLRAAGLLTVR